MEPINPSIIGFNVSPDPPGDSSPQAMIPLQPVVLHGDDQQHLLSGSGQNDSVWMNDQYISGSDEIGKARKVDYILVHSKNPNVTKEHELVKLRECFEKSLESEGVILEAAKDCPNTSLHFTKMHVPWDTLLTYAERLKVKMPLKGSPVSKEGAMSWKNISRTLFYGFYVEEEATTDDINNYTAPFRKDFIDKFAIDDRDKFFTTALRSYIAREILLRAKFGDAYSSIGLQRMLSQGAYEDAYPLHAGPYVSKDYTEPEAMNERMQLYKWWASPRCFYKFQPLDLVRQYFGEKIAFYFAWLGFYTQCLLPVSLVGVGVFIYGIVSMKWNTYSAEVCSDSIGGKILLCPDCDRKCDYKRLKDSCLYSRMTSLFENEGLIVFAVVMSCWGTLFLEFWRRKERELQYEWDVTNFEDQEVVRPEFEAECKQMRVNPVTGQREHYMTRLEKIPRYVVSFTTVVFMVLLVVSALLAVIVYRTAMSLVFRERIGMKATAKILTTATAATMNLIFILIMSRIYVRLAIILTNWERPRTESEYDSAFTLKMYLFQFFNNYSSIFYIAFFKGSFAGRPGAYNYDLGNRSEECDPSGCLIELSIQMIIVFGGKQLLNNVLEIGKPVLMNLIRQKRLKSAQQSGTPMDNNEAVAVSTIGSLKRGERRAGRTTNYGWITDLEYENQGLKPPQWEKDYRLAPVDHLSLFDEYLEMVVQFGFVTLFVSAFPLAPIFAFLNNIMEIRLDAFKMLTQTRRPPAFRAHNIGVWRTILKTVATLAIVTNGLIIGITSNYIPKTVYHFYYSEHRNLTGVAQFMLSRFSVRDFGQSGPNITKHNNPTECFYVAYRNPPESPDKYKYSSVFWHIAFARVLFIIMFEHGVFLLTAVIAQLIPNVSRRVKIEMQRERFLNQEMLFRTHPDASENKTLAAHEGPILPVGTEGFLGTGEPEIGFKLS